jgi:hypothetical protein
MISTYSITCQAVVFTLHVHWYSNDYSSEPDQVATSLTSVQQLTD